MNFEHPPILLVEDDPNAIFLIKRAFAKAELSAALQVVVDGDEAMAYLSGRDRYEDRVLYPMPSLVLLDIRLPRRSGFEVLSWLRQQPELKRLPVIVLTSSREPTDVNRAYDLGANSYLLKPASVEGLHTMVQTLRRYWLVLNQPPEMQRPALQNIQWSLNNLPETCSAPSETGKGEGQ